MNVDSPGKTIRKVSIGVQRGDTGSTRGEARYSASPNTLRNSSTTWTNKLPTSPRSTPSSSTSSTSSSSPAIPIIVTSEDDTSSLQTSSTSTQLSSPSTHDTLRQSLERLKGLNDKRKSSSRHGTIPQLLAIEQLKEGSPEAARSMRKRGTTALAVLKKKNQQDPFYDFTKPFRRTQSEPFLASWDYTARHAYVATEADKSSVPAETSSASGTAPHSSDDESESDWGEHDVQPVDDMESDQSEVDEDPSAYFERLDTALKEVKVVEAEEKKRIVSGSIEGLLAVLISPTAGKHPSLSALQCYIGVKLDSKKLPTDLFRTFRSRQASIRQRIVKIVKKWIDLFYSDFLDNQPLLECFEEFEVVVSRLGGGKSTNWQTLCIARAKAQHRADQRMKKNRVYRDAPKSMIPILKNPTLLDFHPLEVARQMAILDWTYFTAIPNHEYFRKSWTEPARPDGSLASPRLVEYIAHFNEVCYWVATEIVLTPNPKQRSVVIERFIDLAKLSWELGNFNAVMAIHMALNLSAVSRLKYGWKGVSPKHLQKLKEIEAMTDPSHNYANYRRILAETPPPVIPFQALYLKELTFIEENPDRFAETGWINFEKMSLLGKVMTTISRQQAATYKLNEVDVIMQYLRKPPIILNDKELMLGSRQCEPSQESPSSGRKETSSGSATTGPSRSRNISVRLSRGITNIRQSFTTMRRDDSAVAIMNASVALQSSPSTSPGSRAPAWSLFTNTTQQ